LKKRQASRTGCSSAMMKGPPKMRLLGMGPGERKKTGEEVVKDQGERGAQKTPRLRSLGASNACPFPRLQVCCEDLSEKEAKTLRDRRKLLPRSGDVLSLANRGRGKIPALQRSLWGGLVTFHEHKMRVSVLYANGQKKMTITLLSEKCTSHWSGFLPRQYSIINSRALGE